MKPLRTCRVCGLEAHIEENLELFLKDKGKPFGRDTICKECDNERRRRHYKPRTKPIDGWRDKREKKIIESFERPIKCYFCGEEVMTLEGHHKDSLALHSIDGNHDNWTPSNKTPAHSGCHSTHHTRIIPRRWKGRIV